MWERQAFSIAPFGTSKKQSRCVFFCCFFSTFYVWIQLFVRCHVPNGAWNACGFDWPFKCALLTRRGFWRSKRCLERLPFAHLLLGSRKGGASRPHVSNIREVGPHREETWKRLESSDNSKQIRALTAINRLLHDPTYLVSIYTHAVVMYIYVWCIKPSECSASTIWVWRINHLSVEHQPSECGT